MAAPQQSMVPTYKETSAIPRPNTAYYLHDPRDSAGYALAKLLGALPDASKVAKDLGKPAELEEQSKAEQEQLAALAQMGAEKSRLRIAKGEGGWFGQKAKELPMDAYEMERGRRDADILSGELRDAYAKSGLSANDDPKAFQAFADQWREKVFNEKLAGVDPAYQHGFVTRVGGVFEEMAKAHTGNLDKFIPSQNKKAWENRLASQMDLELTVSKERDAFGSLMDNLMGAESGGNYNAFHGNGNNQSIRFTDMTVGEVLEWQKSGQWKRLGAGSSAVGKYQFIEKTLEQTVRESGIDPNTRFTPAVQDKLIQYRLFKHRGLQDYLDGKISVEQALDRGLALEFAGLKKTDGRGAYDGDGLNKAGLSARKSVAALIAFKDAYMRDPASVKATDDKGRIVLGDIGENEKDLGTTIETVEADYGVSQKEARSDTANALIQRMEADPSLADREDLPDLMTRYKLPKADRDRVLAARDRVRDEGTKRAQLADQQFLQETIAVADKAIRSGNPEDLAAVKTKHPEAYTRLLERESSPPNPDALENDEFLADANFEAPEFPQVAMRAYVDGRIDKATYTSAMRQHETVTATKPVLALPGVSDAVKTLRAALPTDNLRKMFDGQLILQIADMTEANGGRRPSVLEITQVAQQIQQSNLQLYQQDTQTRMARPEYGLPPKG